MTYMTKNLTLADFSKLDSQCHMHIFQDFISRSSMTYEICTCWGAFS